MLFSPCYETTPGKRHASLLVRAWSLLGYPRLSASMKVRAPDPDRVDPIQGLVTFLTSTYDVLKRHPALVPYYLAQHGSPGSNAVRLGACMDRMLARAGVRSKRAFQARRILIIHAIASAAFATSAAIDPSSQQPIDPRVSRRHFAQSLRWLLAGLTSTSTQPT